MRRGGMVLAVLALTGCETMDAESFKQAMMTTLEVTGKALEIRGNYKQAKANGQQLAPQNGHGGSAAAPERGAYAALSCTTAQANGSGGMCLANLCGRPVMAFVRHGSGVGAGVIGAGRCVGLRSDTSAAYACEAGHRYDWGRSICIAS